MPFSRSEISARYRARHREKVLAALRKWQQENPERQKAATAAWRVKRPDYFRERRQDPAVLARDKEANDRYVSANREKCRERVNAYAKRNPGVINAKCAKRYASKLRATPAWLTAEQHAQMKAIYGAAARLTRTTGILFTVDHIVPLQSLRVCGLHVPWNLQILSREANASKGASF